MSQGTGSFRPCELEIHRVNRFISSVVKYAIALPLPANPE